MTDKELIAALLTACTNLGLMNIHGSDCQSVKRYPPAPTFFGMSGEGFSFSAGDCTCGLSEVIKEAKGRA